MNLREFNAGTPTTKTWLAPVCGVIKCGSVEAESQFLNEIAYTSLSDSQGIGVGPHALLPVGEGSLLIPPNTLRTGSVFKLSCKGLLSCPSGAVLTFRLQGTTLSSGTQDLLILTVVKIDTSTNRPFTLDFTVVCRQDGAPGVANFKQFGEGTWRVDVGITPEFVAAVSQIQTFGTDEALSLQLTAESDTPVFNIISQIAYLEI
jgi:hypothetical protein